MCSEQKRLAKSCAVPRETLATLVLWSAGAPNARSIRTFVTAGNQNPNINSVTERGGNLTVDH